MIVAGLVLIGVAVAFLARAYIAGHFLAARTETPAPAPVDAPEGSPSEDGPVRHSLRPWVLRGIDVDEAKAWIDRGFDADHAYLLRSMGMEPKTAARLRRAGLDDSALVALVEDAAFRHRTRHDDLVALAERAPHVAPQAVAWLAYDVDADRAIAYATAGLTPGNADLWRAAGWDLDDAVPWVAARFEPATAQAWRRHGFDPEAAKVWKAEHFGVKQAAEWRQLGDTPAKARDVEQRFAAANITIAEGLGWLARGFSVDEICAGWPAMAVGNDVRAWRADWKGLALTPDEVAEWHALFDHDEATRWLRAGVRSAHLALRLRNRGVGVQEVRSVADRLASVFDAVPVTRDDLLSAAGHLARAGGSPELRSRLQDAARGDGSRDAREATPDLIEDVVDELHRLDLGGRLGAPHAARALARRLEQGLILTALVAGQRERIDAAR